MKKITFPVNRGTKLPACKWGDLTEPLPVTNGHSTGIKTGAVAGIVIIDLDRKNGKDGIEAFAALGPIPTTRSVRTPTGGVHLYYQHPGGNVPNSVSKLAPGVDVRGDGGYVVAPPSLGYEFIGDPEAPIAQLPTWLAPLIQEGAKKKVAQNGTHVPEGGRNAALTSFAGKLRRIGAGEEELLSALRTHNEAVCKPPLPEQEVATIAASVGRYESQAGAQAKGFLETCMTAEELSSPIRPPNYLCEALAIAPGRPPMIYGPAGAGKTFMAQALAISVVTGRPLFGRMGVRQGGVGWLDYEMGGDDLRRRFDAVCRGLGLEWSTVWPGMRLNSMPPMHLNTAGADVEGSLTEFCAGLAVVFIDSFRRALPGEEENVSEISQYQQMLTRISQRTGVTGIFIHHAGKSGNYRGSTAIEDGSGTVWKLTGKLNDVLVKQERQAAGGPRAGFRLAITTTPDTVTLDHLGEVSDDEDAEDREAERAYLQIRRRLLDLLKVPTTLTRLLHGFKSDRRAEVRRVVEELSAEGLITCTSMSDKVGGKWFLVP